MENSLSIITITYNNFDDLIKTLNSLNKYKNNYEIIVVNGGSCTRTLEYLSKNIDIKSISEPDKGISDAFNKGICLATNDAITFLNSGDLIYDDEFYRDTLKKISFSDIVFGDIYYEYINKGIYIRRVNRNNPLNNFNHQATVYKRSIALENQFKINYIYSMDFDQILRCIKKNIKISYSDYISVKMYSNGKSYNHLVSTSLYCCKSILENNYWNISTILGSIYRLIKSIIRTYAPTSLVDSAIGILQKKKDA